MKNIDFVLEMFAVDFINVFFDYIFVYHLTVTVK